MACDPTSPECDSTESPSETSERAAPFSRETLREHRQFKTSLWRHIWDSSFLVILTWPVIYSCVVPFLLLDLFVTIYQAVCFPLYQVQKVRRRDYLIFDRGRLAYLNAIEKVGCVYCSYANGLLAYIAEIAARTELRFCPIKHARPVVQPHSRYGQFASYGNAPAYRSVSRTAPRGRGPSTKGAA